MANHSRIKKCKRPFDENVLSLLIQDFNKKYLDGLFSFSHEERCFTLTSGADDTAAMIYCWIEKRGRYKWVEFRHPHGKFEFWLQDWLEYYISDALGGTIDDEGVGIISNKDPDAFWKTYSDYETSMYKELIKLAKRNGRKFDLKQALESVNFMVDIYRERYPQLAKLVGGRVLKKMLMEKSNAE